MKRVLITGITGFAGSHLADFLLSEGGYEIHGLRRWRSRTENIAHLRDAIHLVEGDILDARAMTEMIDRIEPEYIFHLAAQSFVPASWSCPDTTLTTNIRGQVNLFEAVLATGLDCRIQVACSSEEYGLVHADELPITEDNPLRPLSPYAVSKVAQDLLAWQYHRSHGLHVVRTRGFNHTGPRRGEVFVCSNFAKQIATAEAGLSEPVLRVGNLEATRDFTDVRDMVRAYLLALQQGKPGAVYNVCSGQDISIGDVLDRLCNLARIPLRVERDSARLRPADVPFLRGSAARFQADTGWAPRIPFTQTLEDTLEYWRERITCTDGTT